jgi:signal transduction histidine kinase
VKISQIFEHCISAFTRRAAGVGIDLKSECATDLPTLRGDAMRLEELVSNLVDNAIKFSPNGGEVLLKAVRVDDKTVQISVSDHGIGIPAEELPKIYRRFYQVDGSSTRKFGGQGIGLAIAKRIVEIHGGTIRVESQVGQGSTFYVTLPMEGTSDTPPPVSFD